MSEYTDFVTGLHHWFFAGVEQLRLDGSGLTVPGNLTVGGTLHAGAIVYANGSIPGSALAPGAAVANLGYTPANKAGDTFTGNVAAPNVSIGPAVGAPMQLYADPANYSNISFDQANGYYLRYAITTHVLTYTTPLAGTAFSCDASGNFSVQGRFQAQGVAVVNAPLAGQAIIGIQLDGATRWEFATSPGNGDLGLYAMATNGSVLATVFTCSLTNFHLNVGAATPLFLTRAGQAANFSGGTALHMTGQDPAITFNDAGGATSVAFGQLHSGSGGRVLGVTKADGSAAQIFLDASTGIGTAVQWVQTSDRRLKFDLKPLTRALDTLAALTPYTFGMAATEAAARAKQGHRTAGLIAQDLLETPLERLVGQQPTDEGFLTLDYTGLTAWYVAAFKEVAARLTDIEGRLRKAGI